VLQVTSRRVVDNPFVGCRETSQKRKEPQVTAALSFGYAADYLDFGVVSSLLTLAAGADVLPEPVVCALEFMALA
jgi:hypothetical protein